MSEIECTSAVVSIVLVLLGPALLNVWATLLSPWGAGMAHHRRDKRFCDCYAIARHMYALKQSNASQSCRKSSRCGRRIGYVRNILNDRAWTNELRYPCMALGRYSKSNACES